MPSPQRDAFLDHLRKAVADGSFNKLTLGAPFDAKADLRNVFIRPVQLKNGPQLSLLWRHNTKDITRNLPPAEAIDAIAGLLGETFRDAHLFTQDSTIEYRHTPDGKDLLRIRKSKTPETPLPASTGHDHKKDYLIPPVSGWLRALEVTNERGDPRADMSAKFRQIQKFAELLRHLLSEAGLSGTSENPLRVADMGCGKGYLTFATAQLLGSTSLVTGIELRPELCARANAIATQESMPWLSFVAGSIAQAPLEAPSVVIALHACDTATDDAIARAVTAGARLILLSPCCHKQLRPQFSPPPLLADALRHGILQERSAEILTDALRAELLEWAGYRSHIFEFISPEHTSKNLMLSAIRVRDDRDESRAEKIRALAAAFGIRHHQLATLLGFDLQGQATQPGGPQP